MPHRDPSAAFHDTVRFVRRLQHCCAFWQRLGAHQQGAAICRARPAVPGGADGGPGGVCDLLRLVPGQDVPLLDALRALRRLLLPRWLPRSRLRHLGHSDACNGN